MIAKGERRGEGTATSGYRVFLGGDENILKLDCSDGCTILNILRTIELCALCG